MAVTDSVFRFFRAKGKTPPSGEVDTVEQPHTRTIPAEVPADLPITVGSFRSLWIPPNFLVEPRPAWTEMRNYAHYAPWLLGGNRWVREAGVWYFRLVALPAAAALRGLEWLIERPLRLVVAGFFTWWGWSLITDWLAS